MKTSVIFFLLAVVTLQAQSEWTVVTESELPAEEEYEWRVWIDRAVVKGAKREKQTSDEQPEFEIDFSFAAKPQFLKIMKPEYLKYKDGWFAYINCGEFGGGLSWHSSDGAERQEIATKININGITEIEGHLFVYGGLAHLSPPYHGFIRKLELEDGKWVITGGVDLPSPVLILAKPTSTLEWNIYRSYWVVCSTLIGHYDPVREDVEFAYGYVGYSDRSRSLWKYKTPNSIVGDLNGRIYIGTDIGILRIPDETWVVPKEAQPVDAANASNAAGVDLNQLPRIR